ncbi:MAG: potassium-transporting ATPase subunit KdpA, partial [Nocardiaceae bacterium]|nr:potassium-transporting ATPase subunit KdpA [Nocardiaceae bacterium]
MSPAAAGALFAGSLLLALVAVHVPLGDYMFRVYARTTHSRVERVVYRLVGVDPSAEHSWPVYARSVLAFSAVGILLLF